MPLKKLTDVGEITVTEKTIEEIAGYAATHCYGVVGMCEKSTAEVIKRFFGSENLRKGIKVVCRDGLVSIEIHIKVSYGVNIKVLAENVKSDITYAVEKMTQAKIKDVTVCIDDIVVNK
ncbi:MAG: Asp23/Gls24 family envelope stress response protein [Clostridia bacterium]|nr:Asp23/Gls24 family envelope stress response protein [Clostridia bacterium]